MTDLNKVVEAVKELTGESVNIEIEEYYHSDNYYNTRDSILDNEHWFEHVYFPECAIEDAEESLEDSYDKEVIEEEGSDYLARS